jgi:hypothetical protein
LEVGLKNFPHFQISRILTGVGLVISGPTLFPRRLRSATIAATIPQNSSATFAVVIFIVAFRDDFLLFVAFRDHF